MSRYYDIDEANQAIPDVERILLDLRDQRAELIRLRDEVLAVGASGGPDAGSGRGAGGSGGASGSGGGDEAAAELRRMRLRMQGLIDQMQAGVTRLVERDVTLREIETGLVDFPALANGRPIWLCWRLGEGDVEWWHELDDGFAGRKPLSELT